MKKNGVIQLKNIILLIINVILGTELISLGITMAGNGSEIYRKTDILHKDISGNNFSMLVANTNEISLVIKWLAFFGILVVLNLIIVNIFNIWETNLSEES